MTDAPRPGNFMVWECPDAPEHLRYTGQYVTVSVHKGKRRVECLPIVLRGASREAVVAKEATYWAEEVRAHAERQARAKRRAG